MRLKGFLINSEYECFATVNYANCNEMAEDARSVATRLLRGANVGD